jgi:DNA helicase II / ATP-dependent DNA helicase PcrA
MHPSVRDRLERLMPDQRAAATAPRGPVLCVAPAGSGKTTTLVARVCWLVDGGVPAEGITAVTFNTRAAEELRERLRAALLPLGVPGDAGPRVRTFHALGREVLAEAGVDVAGLVDRAGVLDAVFGPLPPADARLLDDTLSRLKLDPGAITPPLPPPLEAACRHYELAMAERGALDFDDLVALATRRLETDDALLAAWRARCATLLVDEVQDVDATQLRLALLLARPAMDLFAVGDDDQTIYAWRLADVRRILRLAAELPGLRRVDLVTNHRCPPQVVRRAARLVAHGRERFDKRIEASPRAEGTLELLPDPGDDIARARALMATWGRGPGERAVLARTNAELRPYVAAAVEAGIPYRVAEPGLLLDDPRVDGLLDAAAPHVADGVPLLCAIDRAAAELDEDLLVRGSVLAWAAAGDGLPGLRARLQAARAAQPELADADGSVTLATVHGTKGLEWEHVACVGFDATTFPSARALSEAADPDRVLEEERRLAYVAWTRARRSLTIVYDPDEPSAFLCEAFDEHELRAPQ